MLFKSGVISSASGSFGGLTASRNRGGMYFRARAIPVNPSTGLQVALRTIFGNLASAWQILTEPQRDAWTTYANNVQVINRLGDPITLTGQQMFIRCNTPRMQAGMARIDDGPTIFSLDALSPVTAQPTEASQILGITFEETDAWVGEDDAGLLVYGSDQKSDTVNYFKGPYRFANVIPGDGTVPPTSPFTSIINPFALTVDNHHFTRVLSVRADGRISATQFIGPNVIGA